MGTNLGWGGGQALVQKRGQMSDGGIGKIFAGWGDPQSPQEKTLGTMNINWLLSHFFVLFCFVLFCFFCLFVLKRGKADAVWAMAVPMALPWTFICVKDCMYSSSHHRVSKTYNLCMRVEEMVACNCA